MSFEDWKTDNPRIDDEHRNLHRMLSSLRAVVASGSDANLVVEAISVMKERMKLHFDAEEREAIRKDQDAYEILRTDHQALMLEMDKVRAAAKGSQAERQAALDVFMAALDKHDQEIDVPLFRMMGGPKPL